MKKKFTLLCFFLAAVYAMAMAAAPIVPASNLTVPTAQLDGDRFNITFTKGSGAFRLIVVKEGSPVTTQPSNGTDYINFNSKYGTPGTGFNGNDGYVVFRGSHGSTNVTINITGFNPGTTYYVTIWEFNGTGAATEYLLTATSTSGTTKSAPADQSTISSFTNVAGNKLTVNWTGGNGDRTLILARKGAPVNAGPEQLKDYTSSGSFGSGNVINGDNFVVYEGSGNLANITDLEPNTTYHFAIFEFNGERGPVYKLPGSTASHSTTAGPTEASGNISFTSVDGNRVTLSFSNGNGKYQLIIARKGQPVTAVPQNGETYASNLAYGSGYMFPTGDYVVKSTETSRTVTNLDPVSTYYFRIYEYDIDSEGNTYYLTSSFSEKEGKTAFPPTDQPGDIIFKNVTGTQFSIDYTPGVNNYRLIVVKEGGPVDATPEILEKYDGNQNFGLGEQITPGNYVINGATNSSAATVSRLTPGGTYHVAIWGFNGKDYPVYGDEPARASITIPNQPTSPATSYSLHNIEGNAIRLQWQGGDGSGRIVVAKKGSAVTGTPTDGVVYNHNARFTEGDILNAGEYVVHDGSSRGITIQNLEPGTTYHFSIFEYNLSGGVPDYLPAPLSGTCTTVSAPSEGPGNLSASDIQDLQAKINFSAGTGSGRLFLMRAGSPVNAGPQDLVDYTASNQYGIRELGNTGNYVVHKTTNSTSFVVTNLLPNTRYYVTAYEYNGSSNPVYLRPGTSFDFVTTGSGTPPPTTHSTNPSFSLIDGNRLTLQWNEGDGAKRIVVMREGAAVTFTPTNGADYSANTEFGSGEHVGDGQYVVYDNSSQIVTITGLQPATTYHFAVFEYNGSGTLTSYLVGGHLEIEQSTAQIPAAGSTNLNAVATGTTLNISWNSGPGAGRLVVMKENQAISGTPANMFKYGHSTTFKNGTQIAPGEFVVYAGTGNSVTVTGLENGKTYHYTIFEYNGENAPMYNIIDVISGSTPIGGGLPLKWLSFTVKEDNGVINLDWATTEEVHTSHFVVERSIDNGAFTSIGTVQAKGDAIRNDYHYEDRTQPVGNLVYRIKQVDADNQFEYSKLVPVRVAARQGAFKLYPNPASGSTRISLPGNLQQATLKIFTQAGLFVKTLTVSHQQELHLRSFAKGVYHMVITGGGQTYNERLIIK